MGALSLPAVAQTVESSSTVKVPISAAVPAKVSVTQVQPFALGNWAGAGDLEAEQQFCVWSSTGSYSLTATTTEGGNRFGMLGPKNRLLDYNVQWNDGGGYQPLSSGQTYSGLSANSQSISCSSAADSSSRPFIKVSVAEADLSAAKAGSYSDVLEILISVE
ncbi:hypothetical protein FHR99_000884 [Litorivivens lipolytica]|uniref:Spore coat protein U domain-containing protein n=1 Tax=Litorivivens lipolytica TaxID=1524264 RepID=A0A7W4W3U5_9GAMM|nr:hypothetical protein [Litorivivens lipolytica]MBB3046648.1 hypothetical protein [Litorivivens lipolytica]